MEYVVWIWLGLLVLLIIFELVTTSLTTIWFAGGALVSFIMAMFNAPLWTQIAVFFAVSVVLLIFTRPVFTKILKIGVGGQEWTARAQNDSDIIPENTIVEIVGVSGVKLIVKRAETGE